MLGQSAIKFRRLHFINDLYDYKEFLRHFSLIEFSNLRAFANCMLEGFYVPSNILMIHIHTVSEFQQMKKIIQGSDESDICNLCELSLVIHDNNIFKEFEGIEDKNFVCIVNTDYDKTLFTEDKAFQTYRSKNPLYMHFTITYDNINLVFENIVEQYMKDNTRMFYLDFDYVSFEEKAKLSDLHRLYFRISRFVIWSKIGLSQREKKAKKYSPMILWQKHHSNPKPIFVDKQLNLYYSERHFIEGKRSPLFKLQKKKAEAIPYKELNTIRQYLDLSRAGMIFPKELSLAFIDYYQNSLIMTSLNEVPYITELITRWFN